MSTLSLSLACPLITIVSYADSSDAVTVRNGTKDWTPTVSSRCIQSETEVNSGRSPTPSHDNTETFQLGSLLFCQCFFTSRKVAPTPSVLEAVRLMKAGDYLGCSCRCHSSSNWSLEVPVRGTSQPRVVRKGSKGPWKTWRILKRWTCLHWNQAWNKKSSGPVAWKSFRRKFHHVPPWALWTCGVSPSKLHRPAISTSSFQTSGDVGDPQRWSIL